MLAFRTHLSNLVACAFLNYCFTHLIFLSIIHSFGFSLALNLIILSYSQLVWCLCRAYGFHFLFSCVQACCLKHYQRANTPLPILSTALVSILVEKYIEINKFNNLFSELKCICSKWVVHYSKSFH